MKRVLDFELENNKQCEHSLEEADGVGMDEDSADDQI